ncbi:MAG: glycosyltransferase family 4 protein [Phycisphaerales bacterium]|nr:MAG: glycosyltransferase family 4 protein [Phycisphaerales bacterium]
MASVSDTTESQSTLVIRAGLCIDREAFDRFGRVLRRLLVGLVDQAVSVRLLSCDPHVETLTLGPVQTLVHKRVVWPVVGRRIDQLLDALSQKPPTVMHAVSSATYRVAGAVADAFDTDLVFQVTSLKDCDAIGNFAGPRVGRFIAFSQPLATVLEEQLKISTERIDLVRPGVLASQRIACFADPQRVPAILCMSPLERGSGVDELIEAVDVLRRRDHTFMLFLLGTGRQEPALRRMIHGRALSPCVTLAHPTGGVAQAFHSADIFVRPTVDSAFNDDGLLAMAAGMAVVTAPNSICDHFRSGETALVCEKPKAEPLAAALGQLLSDKAGARRLATTAMEYVRANHAVSRMAERTAEGYHTLALARATFSLKE